MKKECNVVMLATEKVSNIVQLLSDTISYTTTENIPGGKYQYLYITSDEEIEKPCWYINNNKDTVYFIKDFKSANEDWNKIIATTDISLIEKEKYSGDKLYSIIQQYHEYCTWVEYITPMEWIKENLK